MTETARKAIQHLTEFQKKSLGKSEGLWKKVEVVIATRNAGKLREIHAILSPLGLKILSLRDFPDVPEIIEDGQTFEENAVKKAAAVARQTGTDGHRG